jgi:hypothetical protein
MPGAGLEEELEGEVVDRKEVPEGARQVGSAQSVAGVDPFIPAAGIVENGKELDHFKARTRSRSHGTSVLDHPRPMAHSVGSVPRQTVLR